MKFFVLLLSINTLALGAIIPSFDDRIIGGEETTIENHPYQISLYYEGRHNCGGSILNKDTILTAAHCVNGYNYDHITVRVGATDHTKGEEYIVSKIIEHEDYFKGAMYNNDMAVMKLARPLTFSSRVQPIPLQPSGVSVPVGTRSIVTGWGTTVAGTSSSPVNLREVDVAVISREDCQRSYRDLMSVTESMLCAQTPRHDSCQGDSGGPLVANGHLIGVVSWGYGCADARYPGVYADVAELHAFVARYM